MLIFICICIHVLFTLLFSPQPKQSNPSCQQEPSNTTRWRWCRGIIRTNGIRARSTAGLLVSPPSPFPKAETCCLVIYLFSVIHTYTTQPQWPYSCCIFTKSLKTCDVVRGVQYSPLCVQITKVVPTNFCCSCRIFLCVCI